MTDQAETLRKMMHGRKPDGPGVPSGPPVITFSSGKGGVGKSCLVSHMGTLLARSGLRVLLVDGDFGLANLDILLGVQSGAPLEHVLSGKARLQDAIVGVEPNLWLLPSSSGLAGFGSADAGTRRRLAQLFEDCPWEMDVVLLDIGAGIQPNALSLHSPLFKSVIVLTPEPTSLADAYALIKILHARPGIEEFSVIVNRVTDGQEARQSFQRLKDVANRFLGARIDYLGHWQRDEKITRAVMKRKILLDLGEEAVSVASLRLLTKSFATRLLGFSREGGSAEPLQRETPLAGNTAGFWKTLLGSVAADGEDCKDCNTTEYEVTA